MKSKIIAFMVFSLLLTVGCNPYKGFEGVSRKGMKYNTTPSQELHNSYKKETKRMKRQYKREMKRRKKRMGSED